ncbi:MAG: hypothetical protein CMH94_09985 [Oceanicaulis sp.]|uniref:Membrane protein n=1 Tax=Maricaulis virginensis TaxID=144022 RepID=A0A9W6IL79_9PROT|nr:DUF599 family protein [Maricaulis virginensis]MBI75913.1 hypothetical protein [Oceanicaulis sp.]GLK52396.1 membrane protein [Maricaulis virginensis]
MSDYYGVIGFLLIAGGFSWLVDHSPFSKHTLSRAMDVHRRRWMEGMANRQVRIMDSQIIAGLQNGIAFFASTALLGIGAAFTLITALDPVMSAVQDVPFLDASSRLQWEVMSLGLLVIYAYAFFKFGWAYRLVNYSAMLLGATPDTGRDAAASEDILAAARRAGAMNVVAGRQFNRGLRTLFMSIGYLAWIGGPAAQILVTLAVAAILIYRQFASPALAALKAGDTPARG